MAQPASGANVDAGPGETGGFWLDKQADEYKRAQHLLHMCFRGRTKDLQIWKIDNPPANVNFERRTQGMLILDCWVDLASLDSRNSLFEVCHRGFVFPVTGTGLVFTHGVVKTADPEPRGSQTLILCRVAVGRSFIKDDPTGPNVLPAGFDSLYLSSPIDADGDGVVTAEEYEAVALHNGRSASQYSHEYVILDPSQVQAVCVARFEAQDPNRPSDGSGGMEVFDRYDFFDPVLYQPVSLRDKMTGTHASGEASTHKLIPIQEAYASAIEQSKNGDSALSAKREQVSSMLTDLDDKLREVNMNFASVEEKIYQTLKEAMVQLQNETKAKISSLLSTELELRRQMEQIEFAETYLEAQRTRMTDVEFLQMWRCHASLRHELSQQRPVEMSALASIKADLELRGSLQVVQQGAGDAAVDRSTLKGALSDLMSDVGATPANAPSTAAGVAMSTSASSLLARTIEELQGNPAVGGSTLPPDAANQALAGVQYSTVGFSGAPNTAGTATSAAFGDLLRQQMMQGKMDAPTTPMQSMTVTARAPPPPVSSPGSVTSGEPRTVAELKLVANKFQQFSMSKLAERKKRQLGVEANPQDMFFGSNVVAGREAETVYFCLPFVQKVPKLQLLYSSRATEPSVPAILREVQPVLAPTVVLARAGEFVFGAYVTNQWRVDGVRFGSPKCYLFSVTNDLKFPYHGRQKDTSSQMYGGPVQHDCLACTPNLIQFGLKDLAIPTDLNDCTSELEFSYGIGFKVGSLDAKTFLAGQQQFDIDDFEVWALQ